VDNLPIQFGTDAEQCDLLFILPLNPAFAQEVNRTSIIKRVMDVRQGVLERNSFKMVYLCDDITSSWLCVGEPKCWRGLWTVLTKL
jgi:hypothetical protein